MRVAIINPWARRVDVKEMEKSLQGIYENLTHESQKLVDDFNVVQLGRNVMLYVDGEGFLKPDVPVWYILGHGKPEDPRPLCGMGIIFGGVNDEGDDLPLGEYISERFCRDAVTWTDKLSTGTLQPTQEKPGLIIIGQPILKDKADG